MKDSFKDKRLRNEDMQKVSGGNDPNDYTNHSVKCESCGDDIWVMICGNLVPLNNNYCPSCGFPSPNLAKFLRDLQQSMTSTEWDLNRTIGKPT